MLYYVISSVSSDLEKCVCVWRGGGGNHFQFSNNQDAKNGGADAPSPSRHLYAFDIYSTYFYLYRINMFCIYEHGNI